jgi:hypothetical protein
MHIQKNPQQFQVVLTTKEIHLIAYGLFLYAANPGTQQHKVEECIKLMQQFNNAVKQSATKGV